MCRRGDRSTATREAVAGAVNAVDPEGILDIEGLPPDEYDLESDDFVRLVEYDAVSAQTVRAIWEWWFGPQSAVDRDPELLGRLAAALARIPSAEG